jgi:hypothetical protein
VSGESDRVLPTPGRRLDAERFGAGTGVGADQYLTALSSRTWASAASRMVSGRCCSTPTHHRPQIDRQRLPGALLAVVDERAHGAEAIAAPSVVGSAPCLSECAVTKVASRSMRSCPPARRRGCRPRSPRAPPLLVLALGLRGSPRPPARCRRVRAANNRETVGSEATDPSTVGWARTADSDIGQTVTTERFRGREVEQPLARIMDRPGRPPRATDRDRPSSERASRLDCRNNNAPDDETTDSRAESRTTFGTGLRSS